MLDDDGGVGSVTRRSPPLLGVWGVRRGIPTPACPGPEGSRSAPCCGAPPASAVPAPTPRGEGEGGPDGPSSDRCAASAAQNAPLDDGTRHGPGSGGGGAGLPRGAHLDDGPSRTRRGPQQPATPPPRPPPPSPPPLPSPCARMAPGVVAVVPWSLSDGRDGQQGRATGRDTGVRSKANGGHGKRWRGPRDEPRRRGARSGAARRLLHRTRQEEGDRVAIGPLWLALSAPKNGKRSSRNTRGAVRWRTPPRPSACLP